MTKSHVLAATAAIVFAAGLIVSDVQAQQQVGYRPTQAPAAVGPVALLDVSRVFKNHSRFKSSMEAMKAQVQQIEAQVKTEKETLRKMAEQLQELQSGSPDYKQLEEQAVKRNSDLQVWMQLQRKDLMQQESKIYHNAYTEIQQEVESVAAARGFALVIRFNGEDVDRQKPDDVLRDINKSVIWFNRGLDITDEVLARIEQRSGYNNAATGSSQNRAGIPLQPRR